METIYKAREREYVKRLLSLIGQDPRPDSDYDKDQLAAGLFVELEHTTNPEVAKAIAKTHLDEYSDYYIKLNKAGL